VIYNVSTSLALWPSPPKRLSRTVSIPAMVTLNNLLPSRRLQDCTKHRERHDVVLKCTEKFLAGSFSMFCNNLLLNTLFGKFFRTPLDHTRLEFLQSCDDQELKNGKDWEREREREGGEEGGREGGGRKVGWWRTLCNNTLARVIM